MVTVYNNCLPFQYTMYSYDSKAEFSAAFTPDFSVTRSFRNHCNMLIGARETFLIISAKKRAFLIISAFKQQCKF